jgi:hypothetical protein
MPKKIWYASYGSNLLRERFLAYIRGGRPPGAKFIQVGCSDPTPPSHDHGIMILHGLYFAEVSRHWENAGVAFVDTRKDSIAKTLGRMYLISTDQFKEVVLQENGYRETNVDLGMDLERTIQEGSTELREGLYRTLLCLGEEGGHPIFTFTAAGGLDEAPLNPPGPLYLTIIVRGLRETFGLSDTGIVDYLRDRPGIRGQLPDEELERIVGEAGIIYPNSFT